jgi:uncharacterized Zn finger protein (UPF0148 family)
MRATLLAMAIAGLLAGLASLTLSLILRRRMARRYERIITGQDHLIDELIRALHIGRSTHCPACGEPITDVKTGRAVCGSCGVAVTIFPNVTVSMASLPEESP